MKLSELIHFYENIVPLDLQEEWDNSGLQIGRRDKEIGKVLFAMDIDEDAVDYAKEKGFDLIFSHHPMLFTPLSRISDDTPGNRAVMKAVAADIACYSSHTNLDSVRGGTSDVLGSFAGLKETEPLSRTGESLLYGLGRIGYIEPVPAEEYLEKLKENLGLDTIIVYGDTDRDIYKVAVCGGSGGDFIGDAVKKEADIYITGDIKYHDGDAALDHNLMIADIGHYESEFPVLKQLQLLLTTEYPDLETEIFERRKPLRRFL